MKNKRILANVLLALVLFTVITSFNACSVGYTEEDAKEIIAKLYQESLPINEYIWGDGLPYDTTQSIQDVSPWYVNVDPEAEYTTLADFKSAILSVYSSSYVEGTIIQLLFDGYPTNTSYAPRYREKNGVLQIDVSVINIYPDVNTPLDLGSITITKSQSDRCEFTIGYEPVNGTPPFPPFTAAIVKVKGNWRFDTSMC